MEAERPHTLFSQHTWGTNMPRCRTALRRVHDTVLLPRGAGVEALRPWYCALAHVAQVLASRMCSQPEMLRVVLKCRHTGSLSPMDRLCRAHRPTCVLRWRSWRAMRTQEVPAVLAQKQPGAILRSFSVLRRRHKKRYQTCCLLTAVCSTVKLQHMPA